MKLLRTKGQRAVFACLTFTIAVVVGEVALFTSDWPTRGLAALIVLVIAGVIAGFVLVVRPIASWIERGEEDAKP